MISPWGGGGSKNEGEKKEGKKQNRLMSAINYSSKTHPQQLLNNKQP
jgi:hypothetical protein